MRYFFKPTIVALDIDGVINSSPLAKTASNLYISWVLRRLPLLKKVVIEVIEMGEFVLRMRYEVNGRIETVYRWSVPYMGIITDRTPIGLQNVFRDCPHFLDLMSFIQIRKSLFANSNDFNNPELWKTKYIKPQKGVLYNLAEFAKEKGVEPIKVLIIDDDPSFRRVARDVFGFSTEPDDTEHISELPLVATRLTPIH